MSGAPGIIDAVDLTPEQLDLVAASAWPATETVREGGWLLRRTPGLDRQRSNSALPLRDDPDLDVAERFYRGGTPLVACPDFRPGIDASAARRGWVVQTRTIVLAAELATIAPPRRPVAVLGSPSARWQRAWADCEERDDVDAHVRTVFPAAEGRVGFALAAEGQAVGTAIAGDDLVVGLFGMAVAADRRREGLGRDLLGALAEWGRSRGARIAFLQVLETNVVARALYERAGFTESYRYHYRGPAV